VVEHAELEREIVARASVDEREPGTRLVVDGEGSDTQVA
jgi:hypothetical protein